MTARVVSGDPLGGQPEGSAAGFSAATRGVRTGIDTDAAFGAVVPPIVLSSNFSFTAIDQPRRYDYTRSGNPTRDHLASVLASLEGEPGRSSRRPGWRRSRLCCTPWSIPVTSSSSRTTATGAVGGCSTRSPPRATSGSRCSTSPTRTPFGTYWPVRPHPAWSGWKPPPTRFCGSPTCAPSPTRRTPEAPWSRRTTRSCRRTSSDRSSTASTWWCTPRPSTSTGTVTWWPAAWLRPPTNSPSSWRPGRTTSG